MIVAMAGLPGTGKSTLARAWARQVNGVVLDKDTIRQAVFGGSVTYTRDQDDLCFELMYHSGAWLLDRTPGLTLLLDGRTFLRAYQVRAARVFATRVNRPLHFVECVCPAEVALERITATHLDHPAANRDADLYHRLRTHAEPITETTIRIDTSRPLRECLRQLARHLPARAESNIPP